MGRSAQVVRGCGHEHPARPAGVLALGEPRRPSARREGARETGQEAAEVEGRWLCGLY